MNREMKYFTIAVWKGGSYSRVTKLVLLGGIYLLSRRVPFRVARLIHQCETPCRLKAIFYLTWWLYDNCVLFHFAENSFRFPHTNKIRCMFDLHRAIVVDADCLRHTAHSHLDVCAFVLVRGPHSAAPLFAFRIFETVANINLALVRRNPFSSPSVLRTRCILQPTIELNKTQKYLYIFLRADLFLRVWLEPNKVGMPYAGKGKLPSRLYCYSLRKPEKRRKIILIITKRKKWGTTNKRTDGRPSQ